MRNSEFWQFHRALFKSVEAVHIRLNMNDGEDLKERDDGAAKNRVTIFFEFKAHAEHSHT